MTIRTIIIDDSPDWRDILTRFVKLHTVLELVGTYSSALEAYPHIIKNEIDFILTDIDMPDINGISFIKNLERPPLVVFVSSHLQFAIEGFEAAAVDYLVKPFEIPRFLQCIERVRLRFEAETAMKANNSDSDDEYFFLKVNQDSIKLRYNEVLYMRAMENYVLVHTISGTVYTVMLRLSNFEKTLPETIFVRCHRSYLINYRLLTHINKTTLSLVGGHEVPISEHYFDKIQREIVHEKTIRR